MCDVLVGWNKVIGMKYYVYYKKYDFKYFKNVYYIKNNFLVMI